jgi:hypothetical protein
MVRHAAPGRQDADPTLPTLGLPPDGLARLAPRLQQGVRVRVPAGCAVSEFLVTALGIDPEYVRTRITTVFLDGAVVDDLEAARLHDGSCLALSAAMPGLVGATLRKGGYYAAMRSAITLGAQEAGADPEGSVALVQVKLFNLLIEELGPALLAHGVGLAPAEAVALLGEQAAWLPSGVPEVWLRVVAG